MRLNFNGRVLRESEDQSLPIYERIKFMAIYSSNLDEYYRVKVAGLYKLATLKKKRREKWLTYNPQDLINQIVKTIDEQQQSLGEIWRNQILPELYKNNIILLQNEHYHLKHHERVREYFQVAVLNHLSIQLLSDEKKLASCKWWYLIWWRNSSIRTHIRKLRV
ncbi:MAG: hypothetical protein U5K54_04890 [Cytophagales bacterium]|nr:hypothetical protein [Cytophagales bacterium]